MGLLYDTSKWTDALWNGHLSHSQPARQIIRQGQKRQDKFPEFSTDVHALLYLKNTPPAKRKPAPPGWAQALLKEAGDLPEWASLRQRCQRNGFTAGLATETILDTLVAQVPQQAPPRKKGQNGSSAPAGKDTPQEDAAGDQRRKLRQACREATKTLDETEAAMDGLLQAVGLDAGNEPGHPETLQSLEEVRKLYELIRTNKALRSIAEMAGRLSRLGATHKRCKVTPAVGSIKGVTLGGDLGRLLPSELVGLRSQHRLQRLQTLGRIMEKRALQYEISGHEPLVKGPVICLVDESDSMLYQENYLWAKAVALALLATATQQKRHFCLIGFDTEIRYECQIAPGTLSLETLLQALSWRPDGGTSFSTVLTRAMDVLETSAVMRQADCVMVTDGRAPVSDPVRERVAALQQKTGMAVYGILIGRAAKLDALKGILTEAYQLSNSPAQESEKIAPLLAALG